MSTADWAQVTADYLRSLQRLGRQDTVLSPETWAKLQHLPATRAVEVVKNKEIQAPVTQKTTEQSLVLPVGGSLNKTGNKEADLAALRERAMVCVKCPHLVRFRHNVVFGLGSPNAEIMFVGEAPGADEDLQGEPFVGKAGQLLTKMIEAMGLKREDVYIANVLKCRPDMPSGASGNRKPTSQEMQTCLPYLKCQIQIIQPKAMVALGATAVEGLLGSMKKSISQLRGTWQEFEGIPFMPTFHPSYLLRDPSIEKKRIVWEDLLATMSKVGMPISDKQRRFFIRQ